MSTATYGYEPYVGPAASRPNALPTPEEIAAECALIQATWSPAEKARRCVQKVGFESLLHTAPMPRIVDRTYRAA